MKNLVFFTLLSFGLLTSFTPSALAEDKHDHKHDHSEHDQDKHKSSKSGHDDHGPAHGGQFFEDAKHHGIEMVLKDQEILFYMTVDGKPLDMTGAKFKAIIQTEAGTKIHNLISEGSTLKAKLETALSKGSKVVVTGKDSHGDVLQARFVKD
ncbi:MAG: hypothetical protein ACRBBJ_11905 [Rhodomicrobiaceae bacterium]|nr:MAG: hypothetical protein DHS20C07_04180 [Methyloligella sp.]